MRVRRNFVVALGALCAGVALLIAASVAHADAFDEARKVYDRGDFGTAREMFRPLAEQGDRNAQTMMGHFTAGGRGFPQDHVESAKWYRKAAAQGEPVAQCAMFPIAMLESVRNRRTSESVLPQALDWLRQSAEQDVVPCQMWMSIVLRDGKFSPKNNEESMKWLRRAGAFNFFFAHLELARRYARGDGVAKDLHEAYFWASLVALFVERAKSKPSHKTISMMASFGEDTREKLGPQLTPEQRADADQRAMAWTPKPLPPFKTGIFRPDEIEEGTNFVRGPYSAGP